MSGNPITLTPASPVGELVGIQNVVRLPNPAAGAEWTYTFPPGYYSRLLTGYWQLATSAAVASRQAGLVITDGTARLGRITSNVTATASQTIDVVLAPGGAWSAGGVGNVSAILQMPNMWFPPGYTIGSSSLLLQAGDQYSLIALVYDQLDYGAWGVPQGVEWPHYRMPAEGAVHAHAPAHAAPAHTPVRRH